MKRLIAILFSIALIGVFSSCNSKEISSLKSSIEEDQSRIRLLEEVIVQKDAEISSLRSELVKRTTALLDNTKQLEIMTALKNEADRRHGTFEDQKQVEQLIKLFFKFLEDKEYASAWELVSLAQKKTDSKENAIKYHWGLESVRLLSMKGYIPPKKIVTGGIETWETISEVPPNTPTVSFVVTLDVQPGFNGAWNKGLNDRFVDVVKEADGNWRINGLATGP